mmetsp:Transcript_61308/g.146137  ORF Transcript_61308/g.146137 Transcript_61308/m.146137 type:complete len:258 (+) Transcript_61308:421-1194(+)
MSGDQRSYKDQPDAVKHCGEDDDDGLQLRAQGPAGQRSKQLPEGASGDLWEDGVEGVQEDPVVEVCDGNEEDHNETEEGPLVPQAHAVVYPGAMVIQPVDASPAFLAVVRPHLPPRPANHTDLLKVALLHQGEVLPTPHGQQVLDAGAAQVLACRALALMQRHGRAFQLRLTRSAAVPAWANQGLQFCAHRRAGGIQAATFLESLPGFSDELPLVVVLVLLHFQLHELSALALTQILHHCVAVHHLGLHRLLGVEGL